jgi:hypothetical protein
MMSVSYTDIWRLYGPTLRRLLDEAETVLRQAAESHQRFGGDRVSFRDFRLLREQVNAPEMTLLWHSDDEVNRAVHVTVAVGAQHVDEPAADETTFWYLVSAVAWHDDFARMRRSWWQQSMDGRSSRGKLPESVHTALYMAQNIYQPALKESELLGSSQSGV